MVLRFKWSWFHLEVIRGSGLMDCCPPHKATVWHNWLGVYSLTASRPLGRFTILPQVTWPSSYGWYFFFGLIKVTRWVARLATARLPLQADLPLIHLSQSLAALQFESVWMVKRLSVDTPSQITSVPPGRLLSSVRTLDVQLGVGSTW